MCFSEFYVDGTKIPLVDFDVGPSWSGLIPISDAANETGKVKLLRNCDFASVVLLHHFLVILLALPSGPGRKFR
jgi:hypothetical protein